jgi:hypothetical protein
LDGPPRNGAAHAEGVQLSTTPTIVAIASDPALLRSLVFALKAHGYRVAPFRTWKAAEDSAKGAHCIILDGCLPLEDQKACLDAVAPSVGIVLLADDETRHDQRPGLHVLQKPLSGTDLVSALTTLRDH